MLFPSRIQVDASHFSITPAITIEPCNDEICLFMRWGPVSYSTEIHVGRTISKTVWKMQLFVADKVNAFLKPYWERHEEELERNGYKL